MAQSYAECNIVDLGLRYTACSHAFMVCLRSDIVTMTCILKRRGYRDYVRYIEDFGSSSVTDCVYARSSIVLSEVAKRKL